jgi:hypothetical protein
MRYSVTPQCEEEQIRVLDAWWPRTRRHVSDIQHMILIRPKMADAIMRQAATLLRAAQRDDRRQEFLAAVAKKKRRARVAKAELTIVSPRRSRA